MSETRIAKLGETIDLDLMARVAKAKGWDVRENVECQRQQCELVIKKPGGVYPIGFRQKGGTTEVVHDDWQRYAERDLEEIMPVYKEGLFIEKTHLAGFAITNRFETKDEIVVRVSR